MFKKEKIEAECVHKVSFDHSDGKLIALTADNFFFLWDYLEAKLKARFELQSPGISICWNIEEKSKVSRNAENVFSWLKSYFYFKVLINN